jgi:hypothetical protein
MMAADSNTPSPSLADATLQRVRGALLGYIEAPAARSDDLRDALCAMAGEAREKSMLPERLLVVLKDLWHSLPEIDGLEDPAEQSRLLQRIVTMCIREYYS